MLGQARERLKEEIERVKALLEITSIDSVRLSKFLRRPAAEWSDAVARLPELAAVDRHVAQQVVHDLKYAGYIARQQVEVDRQTRLAEKRIPDSFDYAGLAQLRAEAREKLSRVRPRNLSQAVRISGITPADVARRLSVPEPDVLAIIESGELPARKIGSSYRVKRSELDAFLSR